MRKTMMKYRNTKMRKKGVEIIEIRMNDTSTRNVIWYEKLSVRGRNRSTRSMSPDSRLSTLPTGFLW